MEPKWTLASRSPICLLYRWETEAQGKEGKGRGGKGRGGEGREEKPAIRAKSSTKFTDSVSNDFEDDAWKKKTKTQSTLPSGNPFSLHSTLSGISGASAVTCPNGVTAKAPGRQGLHIKTMYLDIFSLSGQAGMKTRK